MNCSKCNAAIDILSAFPNDLCIICYFRTTRPNEYVTTDVITEMWRSL